MGLTRMAGTLWTLLAVLLSQPTCHTQGAAPRSMRVVCYVTEWARWRPAPVHFHPSDVEDGLCSHLVLAFAKLSANDLAIVPANADNIELYRQLTALKQTDPNLKVMLSVKGTVDPNGPFEMLKDESAMQTFASSAAEFLRTHSFDGMDMDWGFPSRQNYHNFTRFMQVLHGRFADYNLILSEALPHHATGQPDLSDLANAVDFFNLMTYDYHTGWDGHSGHHSTLEDVSQEVTSFLDQNIPADKLTLALPFYGNSFQLQDPTNSTIGASTSGPGSPGHLAKMTGSLAYFEICDLLTGPQENVTAGSLPLSVPSPYLQDGARWTGYDDAASVRGKINYAKQAGLGGVNIWTIDMDDFSNSCGQGAYPLMHAVKDATSLIG